MGVLHGNRDRVEPPGPNLVKSRDPLAEPINFSHSMAQSLDTDVQRPSYSLATVVLLSY